MGEQFYYTDPEGNSRALNDGNHSFFLLRAGFGMEGIQVYDERTPYRDGATEKGIYTPGRNFHVKVAMYHESQSALVAYERAFRSDLNPYIDRDTLGAFRMICADGVERSINCYPTGYADDSSQRDVVACTRVLSFYAPDPYWYDPEQQTTTVTLDVDGGLEFPVYDGAAEIAFNDTDIDDTEDINNAGDVDAWPVIRITGAGDNPVITNNETGKLMSLTQSMDANDYIEIDMENATIVFYDDTAGSTTSALDTMSAASEFWPLVRGHNEINFVFTGGAGATMTMTWYNRYLGV